MSNPYDYFHPVTDTAMFFGRQFLVDEVVSKLYSDRPHCYAIFGGRRFGKTSLLRAIEHELLSRQSLSDDLFVAPVYLDLNYEMITSRGAFFQVVLRELKRVLTEHLTDIYHADRAPSVSVDVDDPVHTFEHALIQILQYVMPRMLRIAVLIDESEHILAQPWAPQLHANLRALVSNRPSVRDYLEILMAGSSRFYSKYREEGSPLANVLTHIYLTNLSEDEAYRLINEPAGGTVSLGVADAVWRETAGHPFLTQYVMHHLCTEGLDKAIPDLVIQIAQSFDNERADFTDWCEDIGEVGHQVYVLLLEEGGWISRSTFLKRVQAKPLEIRNALDTLCFHGIAEQDRRRGFRAVGEMFRRWFCENMVPPKPVGLEEVIDLVELRQALVKHFDLEELRTLCFDLSVDYDSLPGEGKEGKARELVAHVQRRGELESLILAVRRERGNII